ncbi:hypothetical protein [Phycobacter azelaicus]|jgi:hypothetical protein|uniref:hypothetical protein n=1 Tax=Phycobacter azelaicus TaxID=2668075 RepID=UPI001865B518|nr:hypothetical protein [Phycobacter azelaicus]MBE1296028.1 hypothetical protein [Paracoccaceae bacterium]
MVKRITAAILFLSVLPLAASSTPISYECDIESYSPRYGGIPDKAYFVIDAEAKTAMAFDPFIYTRSKVPVAVEFKELRADKYLLKWTVEGVPLRNNGTAVFSFSTRIDVAKGTLNMQSWLLGDDGDRRGKGTCKPIKG